MPVPRRSLADSAESALLGLKRHDEAELLLLKGYEGAKEREKTNSTQNRPRIPEALDTLIARYTATSKPEEVKKRQAERAKYSLIPQ